MMKIAAESGGDWSELLGRLQTTPERGSMAWASDLALRSGLDRWICDDGATARREPRGLKDEAGASWLCRRRRRNTGNYLEFKVVVMGD
ncbi:hypothetical protein M0R45_007369 [Rubus argutus]|uniref:Uncharacterized protein n=1 Tax=Rubus argutus TaxID=59490 RepID=A0AAW1XXH4_RUBAR